MQVQRVNPRAVLRRLAGALLLLWLVLTITFALIRLAPGDAGDLSRFAADGQRPTWRGRAPSSGSISRSPCNMHDGRDDCCMATSERVFRSINQ